MRIIGIDPGTTESGVVVWDGMGLLEHLILPNEEVLEYLARWPYAVRPALVLEAMTSYGMPVGKETFQTVFWSGRFAQAWREQGGIFHQMPRQAVKLFWCKTTRAKDSNVIRAMKDRFGEKGTKKQPGLLYGITSHEWQALALAIAFAERE